MPEPDHHDAFRLDEAIDVLARTPECLRTLLGDLASGWIHARERAGSWSPTDTLGHLIHGEDTDWIPRARIILERGAATPFTPFDRDGYRRLAAGASTGQLLAKFAELRGRNLDQLRAWDLGPEQLGRTGTHPELGPVTMRQLLSAWVVHDLGHVRQIVRAMAARYREAVGPWNRPDYLLVLQPR